MAVADPRPDNLSTHKSAKAAKAMRAVGELPLFQLFGENALPGPLCLLHTDSPGRIRVEIAFPKLKVLIWRAA
jgi:hypothetical protein